nr:MAG TPA: hypothetical protein [Caudoviricetes sp.]
MHLYLRTQEKETVYMPYHRAKNNSQTFHQRTG